LLNIFIYPSAKNESDIEYLLNVVADFMGNYCPLSGNNLDDYFSKAIELNCVKKIIPIFTNHRQLLYYPDPSLLEKAMIVFDENKDWESMKIFYQAISRKYFIKKTNVFYNIYIKNAYKNKEIDLCADVFLDILDYQETILSVDSYRMIVYSNKRFVKDKIFVELFEVIFFYLVIEINK